jgi:hemerythrin superfamily protein
MSVDAVTAIVSDHQRLERLFVRIESGEGDRRALVDEVVARFRAHSRAEETEVYPEIADLSTAEEVEIDHAEHEHQEAEHLLKKVHNLVESPHFEQALADFVRAVRHHVEEEEHEVLPALRQAVDAATLRRLGTQFEQARAKHLKAAGYGADAPADDGAELAEATREELYEMAKQADIPGRSAMRKDELAEALRDQQ